MASFVFVHGSWHGAWCWDKLVPLLRDAGHEALAIDLPAHGEDRTSAFRASLARYSKRVLEAVAACSQKPIVVGHSMGGMAITKAAMDAPGEAAALVYVCAFVPLPGESVAGLAREDPGSLIVDSTRIGARGISVIPEAAADLFYNECSEEVAAWAIERLCSDPWRPLIEKLTGKSIPVLPRAYIECTEDRAVSLERQRSMASRTPFDEVVTLETDHSPFLSMPAEFAHLLDGLVKLVG